MFTSTEEEAIEAVPVRLPLKVVAVTVLPRTDTLESTYIAVPAKPVEDLEPKR